MLAFGIFTCTIPQIGFPYVCYKLTPLHRFQKELKRKKIPLEEYATLGEILTSTLAFKQAASHPDCDCY